MHEISARNPLPSQKDIITVPYHNPNVPDAQNMLERPLSQRIYNFSFWPGWD